MTDTYFLRKEILPDGFEYPREFSMIVELGLVDFLIWNLLDTERAEYLIRTLNVSRKRYVPFAEQRGSDDVACWDIEEPGKVFLLENSTSQNDNPLMIYGSFLEWLSKIVPEMIDHIADEIKFS